MSLVFAGVCSRAPGITGRAGMADPEVRDRFHQAYRAMGAQLAATRPDALIVVAAEHFANFFLDNMPAVGCTIGVMEVVPAALVGSGSSSNIPAPASAPGAV